MFGRILAVCLMLAWPSTVFAHEGPGPHGGPTTDAGDYYMELVVKEKELKVFLFEQKGDAPVVIKDAKGRATVLVGQDKETIVLEPVVSDADAHTMVGKLGVNAGAGSRVVVVVEFPGKPAAVGRFAI
jgi:hypothetical protein